MGRGVFQPGVFCICRRPAAWKVPEKLRWNWMPPVRAWHASSFTYIPMRVAAGSSKLRADFSALTKSSEDFETAEALRLELPRAPSPRILHLKLSRVTSTQNFPSKTASYPSTQNLPAGTASRPFIHPHLKLSHASSLSSFTSVHTICYNTPVNNDTAHHVLP